jgi:hypothetical protein
MASGRTTKVPHLHATMMHAGICSYVRPTYQLEYDGTLEDTASEKEKIKHVWLERVSRARPVDVRYTKVAHSAE